jgi:hypothetical protein
MVRYIENGLLDAAILVQRDVSQQIVNLHTRVGIRFLPITAVDQLQ